MTATFLMILGGVVLIAATTIFGLAWAVRRGQFGDLRRGARSIFDEDEPIGRPTDRFPGDPS